ncbi:hypothetical protein [Thauera sp.]|jgi:hypothetical protein|nr:hypothetical protein [Thauera sp.]MDX9885362.1 hypothetical protein [Thauera sp.]
MKLLDSSSSALDRGKGRAVKAIDLAAWTHGKGDTERCMQFN